MMGGFTEDSIERLMEPMSEISRNVWLQYKPDYPVNMISIIVPKFSKVLSNTVSNVPKEPSLYAF